MDASPRPAAYSGDFEYEDKAAAPPPPSPPLPQSPSPAVPRRPHTASNASSAADPRSPLRTRHSEPELFGSPRDADDYPRFEARKRMSADFSDDTMSVGSIGGESPKADRGSWRLHSAVAGPFLTGPIAKDFQSEHLKTPRGKARDDINFDYSGLLFPLAPVIDAIPDTPRGGYNPQAQSFTDISQFENSSAPMDGFNLDGGAGYAARRGGPNAFQSHNGQFYPGQATQGSAGYDASHQQAANGQYYNNGNAAAQQSSAIVATQSSHAHGASYADVVARNGGAASEQSLVTSSGNDSLESLSKGMADSMAQILAKTQNGRSYNEVQLTSLVQKIHLHMNVMGRTSAAIREDYNRIKAKLEQTITDKKVLEATNYHLQQLVQQYEVERQYFHQYVLHSLQSQSSLIYESMGNLSQNVEQSKSTIEELSARLSRELANIQGSRGNDSQLKDILEEIKRVVDVSAITGAQQVNGTQPSKSPARSPQSAEKSVESEPKRVEEVKGGGFRLTPVLLAVLLWIATLGGVYMSAKSAALTELQEQQQPSSSHSSSSILPSDLDRIVDQISQKLESTVQPSEVRKLVYTELKQNHQIAESVIVDDLEKDVPRETQPHAEEKEKSESKPHQPEIAVPSEPSVPVTTDVIEEPKSVVSETLHEEGVPKVEDELVPVEPATVETPSLPTTSVPEAVPEIKQEVVEVEVLPTDQFQVPDAAIAEMLRLNGLPASVIPFDTIPGVVHPPADAIVDSEKPVEPPVESVVITDASKEVSSSIDTTESVVAEVEIAEPAVKIDTADPAATAEASVDVVEITIENPLNPEVIVREEVPVSTNVTSAMEPAVIEEVFAAGAVHSPILIEGSSSTEASEPKVIQPTDAIETLPEPIESEAPITEVKHAEEPVDEVVPVAPTEVIQSVISSAGEDVKDESKVETDIPSIESTESGTTTKSTETRTEPTSDDIPTDATAVDASASLPSKKDTVVETIAADEAQVTEDVREVASDDAESGSMLDTITGSAPFTGLSKALRSLAHRFVDGGEVSETLGEETASESDEVADRESDVTKSAPVAIVDDAKREESTVTDVKDPSATVAEPVAVTAEPSVESIELPLHDAVEPVSIAAVVNNDEAAPESSSSDVITVEITAGGEVGTDVSVVDAAHDTLPAQVEVSADEAEKSAGIESSSVEDTAEVASDDRESKDGIEDKVEVIEQETASAVPETSPTDEVAAAADVVLVDTSIAATVDVTEEASAADKSEESTKDVESASNSTIDAGSVGTVVTSYDATEAPTESELPKESASVVDAETPVDVVAKAHLDVEAPSSADELKSSASSDASALLDSAETKENVEAPVITDTTLAEDAIVASADEERGLLEKLDATEIKSPTTQSEQVNVATEIDEDASKVVVDAESPIKTELAIDESASSDISAVDGAIGSVDPTSAASGTSSDDAAVSTTIESELTEDKADDSDPVAAAVVESGVGEHVGADSAGEGARSSEPSTDATSVDEVVVATGDSVVVATGDDASEKTTDEEAHSTSDAVGGVEATA